MGSPAIVTAAAPGIGVVAIVGMTSAACPDPGSLARRRLSGFGVGRAGVQVVLPLGSHLLHALKDGLARELLGVAFDQDWERQGSKALRLFDDEPGSRDAVERAGQAAVLEVAVHDFAAGLMKEQVFGVKVPEDIEDK